MGASVFVALAVGAPGQTFAHCVGSYSSGSSSGVHAPASSHSYGAYDNQSSSVHTGFRVLRDRGDDDPQYPIVSSNAAHLKLEQSRTLASKERAMADATRENSNFGKSKFQGRADLEIVTDGFIDTDGSARR